MIRYPRAAPPSPPPTRVPSEHEIECVRLRSTLAEERKAHAFEVERLQRAVEGLKVKLKAAEARRQKQEP